MAYSSDDLKQFTPRIEKAVATFGTVIVPSLPMWGDVPSVILGEDLDEFIKLLIVLKPRILYASDIPFNRRHEVITTLLDELGEFDELDESGAMNDSTEDMAAAMKGTRRWARFENQICRVVYIFVIDGVFHHATWFTDWYDDFSKDLAEATEALE